ncbi:hypothetical protein (plasmid) [Streptomyces leeuwenhoekii]|uniref:Uncharacterized protein n=1 Tax=Streptomyces leeuwenhoekii TaxID=1437453 RepID=A0A0F7VKP1_STRLW|nr:hypothetical protein [Streptomyces leeuwenhoekii]
MSCTLSTATRRRPGRRCCRWSGPLDVAQQPGIRLCSLCGAAAELDSVLKGFEHGFGEP